MAKSSRDDHKKWRRLSSGLALKYQVELAQLGNFEHRLSALIEQRDRLIAQFGEGDPSSRLFADTISRKLRSIISEISEVRAHRDQQRHAVHRAKSMAARAEEQVVERGKALNRDASEKQSGEQVIQNLGREQ